MKVLKYNVVVSLQRRRKNGILVLNHIPIRIRVIYGGQQIDIYIGCFVDYSYWDDDLKFVRPTFLNRYNQTSEEINNAIKNKLSSIHEAFTNFKKHNLLPTKEDILSQLVE